MKKKESKFLKDFFIFRTNLIQVFIKFLGGVEDIIIPLKILRNEGKRFFSMCKENPKKADKIFEKYKKELLKKYKAE